MLCDQVPAVVVARPCCHDIDMDRKKAVLYGSRLRDHSQRLSKFCSIFYCFMSYLFGVFCTATPKFLINFIGLCLLATVMFLVKLLIVLLYLLLLLLRHVLGAVAARYALIGDLGLGGRVLGAGKLGAAAGPASSVGAGEGVGDGAAAGWTEGGGGAVEVANLAGEADDAASFGG